jgi:hypothetical protein
VLKLGQQAVHNLTANGEAPDVETAVQTADQAINDKITQFTKGNEQLGNAYREFVAASIRYSYTAAAAMGQTGGKMSDKDYDRIGKSLESSNSPKAFSDNLRKFSNERLQAYNGELQRLQENPAVLMAIKNQGLSEFWGPALQPVEKTLDAETKAWVNSNYDADKKSGIINDTGVNTSGAPSSEKQPAPKKVITLDAKMVENAKMDKSMIGKKIAVDPVTGEYEVVP